MADRIRSEEKKRDELNKLYKAEQEKVMEVTERFNRGKQEASETKGQRWS